MTERKDKDPAQGLTAKQQIEKLIKGHFNAFDKGQEWFTSHAEAVAKLIATDFGIKIGQLLETLSKPKKMLLSMPIEGTVNAASMQVTVTCKISRTELIAKVKNNLRTFFSDTDKRVIFRVDDSIGHFEVILFPDLFGDAEEVMLFPELAVSAEEVDNK